MATYEIIAGPWKGCIIEGKLIPSCLPESYDLRGTFILYTVEPNLPCAKLVRETYETIHAEETDWIPVSLIEIKKITSYQAAKLLAKYNKANPETNWRT